MILPLSTECDRLFYCAGLGLRSKSRHQVLELVGMPRGEQHGVAGLDPQATDRAADMTRADDADAHLGAAVCLRRSVRRPQVRAKHQGAAEKHGTAVAPDRAVTLVNVMFGHGNLLAIAHRACVVCSPNNITRVRGPGQSRSAWSACV
jgi:hypothetical protein